MKVSNDPHLINHAGTTIEIGTGMKEIPLSCEFSRTLTLSQGFHTAQTALGQDGTTGGSNVFSPVFTMNLNEYNTTSHAYYKTNGVTVGEPLQVCYRIIQKMRQKSGFKWDFEIFSKKLRFLKIDKKINSYSSYKFKVLPEYLELNNILWFSKYLIRKLWPQSEFPP